MPRPTASVRDYQSEYRRRIERATTKGLSRSQARGHPTIREAYASKRPPKPLDDARLQTGLNLIRREKGVTEAARQLGVSPERLRHEFNRIGATEKRGRQWVVKDSLPRRVPLYSNGKEEEVTVPNLRTARAVAGYMSQVRRFLETNDRGYISLYQGMSVTDIHGVNHPFETDPSTLYRLAQTGSESFEQIYRIVI
jgi:hypothetical protein